MLLVGIDVATTRTRVGLALAAYEDGRTLLQQAALGTREQGPAAIVAEWLRGARTAALLAIDAPLGWPQPLASSLVAHRAGETIATPPNEMFRRVTDRFIYEKLGKIPLDVGADRIARTAHAALALLGELRQRLDAPIPLAWSSDIAGIAAIEVYPAATLVAHGIRSSRYKAADQKAERREIMTAIRPWLRLGRHASLIEAQPDVLDAVVCLLAAHDFLSGRAMGPRDRAIAEQEGWIWSAAKC